jgi:trimeric autotransporter adhesin
VALTYITVTGTFDDGSGTPLNGQVVFTPSGTVYAAGVPVASTSSPVTVNVISGVLQTVRLLATANAGLTYAGLTGFFYWTAQVTLGGITQSPWSFFLPLSPATADLYALANTGTGGFVNPMTTPGDLIDGGTGGVAQRLGIGTAGQVLTVSAGTAPSWAAAGGFTNPMTTPGDMIYESSGTAPTRLAGNTSVTRNFLTSTGSGAAANAPAWGTIAVSDVPVLNQNTTGNAATATAASALTSLTTAVVVSASTAPTSGQVLTATSGSAATWQAAAAVSPGGSSGQLQYNNAGSFGGEAALTVDGSGNLTASQNVTGGKGLSVSGVSTTSLSHEGVIDYTNPDLHFSLPSTESFYFYNQGRNTNLLMKLDGSSGQLTLAEPLALTQGGTGQAAAAAAYNALSPMTTTGDIEYESGANTAARLGGNTTTTKNFLTSTGSGSASAAPAWGTIASGDMPAGTTSAQGALQLDGTAGDIKAAGQSASAGSNGKSADSGHIHPPGSAFLCTPTQFAPAAQKIFTTTSTSFTWVTPSATTVAAGSNGGEISTVASWSSPSAGVLDVATTTGWATSGTVTVAASGATTAVVTYTGIAVGQLTGCAYVSGSATGTVSTGGAVTAVSSVANTGSFNAPASGSVLVTAGFVASIGTNGDQVAFGLCAHATTTPMLGYIAEPALGSGIFPLLSVPFLVTGLTSGSAYTFDLMWCVLSGQTASMYAFGQTGTAPTLGSGGNGAAITMTVQAV